jgi:asparagine synthetase B (glutamine-hydrolysing)
MSLNSFLIIAHKTAINQTAKLPIVNFECYERIGNYEVYSNQKFQKYDNKFIAVIGKIRSNHKPAPELALELLTTPLTSKNKFRTGQFLIISIDSSNNSIEVMNDYLGCFPIYFYNDNQRLILSDQIRHFRAVPDLTLTLNRTKAVEYLATNFISSNTTLISEIAPLPARHKLYFSNSKLNTSPYCDLKDLPLELSQSPNLIKQFRELLVSVVRDYASESCAFEFSGGLDSSAIITAASIAGINRPATFSIRYPGLAADESAYRAALASMIPLNEHEIDFQEYTLQQYTALANKLLYFPDYPNSSQSLRLLEQAQSLNFSSVLTGFGGDHLFAAGRLEKSTNLRSYLPHRYRQIFKFKRYLPWLASKTECLVLDQMNDFKQELNQLKCLPHQRAILWQIKHANTSEFLRAGQNLAALFNMQKYHPLFDSELLLLALSLPKELLIKDQETKLILRSALSEFWPSKIGQRQDKAEFTPTYLKTLSAPGFAEVLNSSLERFQDLINVDLIRESFGRFPRYECSQMPFVIWNLVGLEIFSRVLEAPARA